MRRIVAAIAAAALVCLMFARPVLAQEADQAHNPVIFVHGLSGGATVVFGDMVQDFKDSGWAETELFVWEYDWTQPNIDTAEQFADEVSRIRAETGASKVDVVAHSMGSLSTRYFIKFLGGQDVVAHWVSIGGVNHGTVVAGICPFDSCDDMKRDSSMVKSLNRGDETPGQVAYQTQSSSCDELALPHSTVPLAGAVNRDVGCLEHIAMPRNDRVISLTRDFLRT